MFDTTYLIVPDVVAHDKDLLPLDKLLLGLIYSLTKQNGYCWASNKYLAEYLCQSASYISKSLKRLEDKGYINREIDNRKMNKDRRKVYVDIEYINKLQYGIKKSDDSLSL